jgi:sulfite dehydrogenase
VRAVIVAVAVALSQPALAEDLGKKVFTSIAQPPCALCHTLEAAGAKGKLGPSLDEQKPDEARALEAIKQGVGVMPSYADKLSPQEIAAVARYVAESVR